MSNQPLHYPQYLPFPEPVRRIGWIPTGVNNVPVQQNVNWPSAQFTPPYAQGGSVVPFVYPDGKRSQMLYSGETETNPGFLRSTWDTMPPLAKWALGIAATVTAGYYLLPYFAPDEL